MAMSTEDRAWLEGRLVQHQIAIEEQLKQHFADVRLAIENGRQVSGHQLLHRGYSQISLMSDMPQGPVTPAVPGTPGTAVSAGSPNKAHTVTKQSAMKVSKGRKSSVQQLVREDDVHLVDPTSRRGKLIFCVNHVLSLFVNFCIVANTVVMFVDLQRLGNIANTSLGLASHGEWTNAEMVFDILEYSFAVVFLVDFIIHIIIFRLNFFKSYFDIADAVIVVVTSLEVFIFTPLASSMGNVSVVRLLRLIKFARAFKACRTFKSFEGLRVLVSTLCFSFGSTFWSLVLIFIFQVMGSIFMCQSLHDFVVDSSKDPSVRAWVNDMYGDGMKSFWTIFELTFSGCWPNYARRIIEEVNPVYSLFYFFYVYIVVFVVVRVVSALFMKETLAQAAKDTEMMVKDRAKKSNWVKQRLSDLFAQADANDDGSLSKEEFDDLLVHPKVRLWLTELGVDVTESETLFALMDDGDGYVDCDEFVKAITKLKGEARSQDLVPLAAVVQRILRHVKALRFSVDSILQENARNGIRL